MSKAEKAGAQQTSLLDVLKKKMRQAREEAEAAKDEADEVKRLLEEERKKREDVCPFCSFPLSCHLHSAIYGEIHWGTYLRSFATSSFIFCEIN